MKPVREPGEETMKPLQFRCERCRQLRPAREFNPQVLNGGHLFRRDCCRNCCKLIDALRKPHPNADGQNGDSQRG
jgi:hypothetical protein